MSEAARRSDAGDAFILTTGERAVSPGSRRTDAPLRSRRRLPRSLRGVRSVHTGDDPSRVVRAVFGGNAQRVRLTAPAPRTRTAALPGRAPESRRIVNGQAVRTAAALFGWRPAVKAMVDPCPRSGGLS